MRGILDKIAAIYGKTWETMGPAECEDVMKRLRAGSVCSDRCDSCAYAGYVSIAKTETNVACFYLQITGKRRPCPAGDGCILFEPGRVINRPRPFELRSDKREWRKYHG